MSINPYTLDGKTIIITGASSGIGRQCAIFCSQMGAKVVLIARNIERLHETRSNLTQPNRHIVINVDLNFFEAVEAILGQNRKEIGNVDGIVHCAGISTTLPLRMINEDHLHRFFQTNVNAAINLTKLLSKRAFMPSGGSIVFMTSVMGVVGEAGKTVYSLTKGALVAGAKSLAIELAAKKIRVNCISPGVVVTPMSANAVYSKNDDSLERIKSNHPLGLGQPEDVGNACVFLLSDAARWITGTNLIVDGGYTAR
jgi:NAD(P)-dependent dehydrogenase (short-subunit alcohol dehydrogenase family)